MQKRSQVIYGEKEVSLRNFTIISELSILYLYQSTKGMTVPISGQGFIIRMKQILPAIYSGVGAGTHAGSKGIVEVDQLRHYIL